MIRALTCRTSTSRQAIAIAMLQINPGALMNMMRPGQHTKIRTFLYRDEFLHSLARPFKTPRKLAHTRDA